MGASFNVPVLFFTTGHGINLWIFFPGTGIDKHNVNAESLIKSRRPVEERIREEQEKAKGKKPKAKKAEEEESLTRAGWSIYLSCGNNIAGTVDVAKVAEAARLMPGVAFATTYMYTCSEPRQEDQGNNQAGKARDRVVVAACSPRMHEVTFRRTVEKAGLNRYFFEMANIREHCSSGRRGQGIKY